MVGSGVYLVKRPNGKPFNVVYSMLPLAEARADMIGGRVVKVKWDDSPIKGRRRVDEDKGEAEE